MALSPSNPTEITDIGGGRFQKHAKHQSRRKKTPEVRAFSFLLLGVLLVPQTPGDGHLGDHPQKAALDLSAVVVSDLAC